MAVAGTPGEKGNSRPNGVTPGHVKSSSRSQIERPSKDGTAQKAAQEVDGLKGYVSFVA